MCRMLLSINPEHVTNIFNGKKVYEYRKVKCRNSVDSILIYSTAPIMKIVGEAKIDTVLEDSPKVIWEKTKQYSGIDRKFFNGYYKNKDIAIAYKLTNVIQYDVPKDLQDYGVKSAPQSFIYITDETT